MVVGFAAEPFLHDIGNVGGWIEIMIDTGNEWDFVDQEIIIAAGRGPRLAGGCLVPGNRTFFLIRSDSIQLHELVVRVVLQGPAVKGNSGAQYSLGQKLCREIKVDYIVIDSRWSPGTEAVIAARIALIDK